MKLDKRLDVLPFCCFSAETCAKYIGQKGYFSNNIDFFKNIDLCIYGTLEAVHDDQAESFEMRDNRKFYRYFIPELLAKPKEKQFRPCTLDNFGLNIGDLIKFRIKDDHTFEIETIYMGHMKTYGTVKVLLGQCYYSFDELFDKYEWYDKDSKTWEPFGVEE